MCHSQISFHRNAALGVTLSPRRVSKAWSSVSIPFQTLQALTLIRVIPSGQLKFRKKSGIEVVDEVKQKVARFKLSQGHSFRTVLIHSGELDPAVEASDYFDFIIPADEMVKG